MIKKALISVYDKQGLETLVPALAKYGIKIISSGGTARRIKEIGYKDLVEVSEYTGHPESPGGLVKTLHPKVHGGLLLDRDEPEHAKWMKENKIESIDLVVVNLYPFEKVVAGGADLETAGHNIDIGGPTMTRSAAKASLLYDKTCIVSDPAQYPEIIKTLDENNGELTTELRKRYALLAFKRTAGYDAAIVSYLEETL
ncbi:IMP cyclohydrolase [Candidatus Bathyarchaeota archaeon]|nr:MAG: IMP cyclohydrolase [Candidatus Bathyarchaeota archaeon]HHL41787.1 IMP cyclohydrolase [Candidatus Bathyarchaeota archaeon]